MLDPATLVLTVAVATACGLAGGYGGRRLAMRGARRDLYDLADSVEGLERRIQRREGQAGAVKREAIQTDLETQARAHLARAVGAGSAEPATPETPKDRSAILRLAPWRQGKE